MNGEQRATKGNFMRRSDSIVHVGLGVATAFTAPIAAAAYGVYLWNSDGGGGDCSTFIQGMEYGAGYLLGEYLLGQLLGIGNQ